MNYQHLQYFQTLAKEGNYIRAADRLYITQSTLSRAIAGIEEEIGAQLFEKQGRTIQITPAGRLFLNYVNEAMGTIERGIDEVHHMMNMVVGEISVSCIYGYMYGHMPRLLRDFRKLYPDVRFHLRQDTTNKVLQAVREGKTDLGIHSATSYMAKYQDLDFYHIEREEIIALVSRDHPLAGNRRCSLKDLEGEYIAGFDLDSGIYYQVKDMFDSAGLSYHQNITLSDDQSIVNMVVHGNATAFVLRNIAAGSIGAAALTIEDDVNKYLDIYLAARKKGIASAAVKTFQEYAVSRGKGQIAEFSESEAGNAGIGTEA